MEDSKQYASALSNTALQSAADACIENNNIAQAIMYYEVWLERELCQPSDQYPLTEIPCINTNLSRDYAYLLYSNQLHDQLIVILKKVCSKNYSYRHLDSFLGNIAQNSWTSLAGYTRMICQRQSDDVARQFISQALEICPQDSSAYQEIVDHLHALNNPTSKQQLFIDTIDKNKPFDFINIIAGSAVTKENTGLGASRFGGSYADLPANMSAPANMDFIAQIDLSTLSQHDTANLLPKSGHLIFFWRPEYDGEIDGYHNKVLFCDNPNNTLIRTAIENSWAFEGREFSEVFAAQETIAQRYLPYEDPDDYDEFDEQDTEWFYQGKRWCNREAEHLSKIFGLYAHCQCDPNDIAQIAYGDNVLLLQIGCGYKWDDNDQVIKHGFIEDGTLLVLINKEDLKNRNFSNCSFEWAHT